MENVRRVEGTFWIKSAALTTRNIAVENILWLLADDGLTNHCEKTGCIPFVALRVRD